MTLVPAVEHPAEDVRTLRGRSGTVALANHLPFRLHPASPQLPTASSFNWFERSGGGYVVDAIYDDSRIAERFIAMPVSG
jgi:hypothetical protein